MKIGLFINVLMLTMCVYGYSQNNFEIVFDNNGGRIDWAAVNNRIAIDRKGNDDFYDIYTMDPDTNTMVCLTSDTTVVPKYHCGNPAWHPSGEYILFQAESERTSEIWQHNIATPGRGRYNDVWVMDSSGTTFNNLTQIPYNPYPISGVLHPQFSKDGLKICWAQRIGDDGPKGQWVINTANFMVNSNDVYIDDIQTYHPLGGNNFYETHDFSENGEEILFSATLHNRDFHTLEIYTFNIVTGALNNLTNLPNVWDEHAHYNKNRDKIIWMSSQGHDIDSTDFSTLRTEWWIMNIDGSDKKQLSHFNTPGYPEYIPNDVAAGDLAFSPNGHQFLGYIITESTSGGTGINVLANLDNILSIEIKEDDVRFNCRLWQNYPNPFNSKTVISYQLPAYSEVELSIYNMLGQKLANLFEGMQAPNSYQYEWDGMSISSGVYFYILRVSSEDKTFVETKKCIVLK